MVQIAPDASGNPNGGFVRDYVEAYPKMNPAERGEMMKFHGLDTLPALHTIARHFTVCDRWFSSVPGPTWTNRLFAMSGTSLGRVKMADGIMNLNLHWYNQATILGFSAYRHEKVQFTLATIENTGKNITSVKLQKPTRHRSSAP